MKMKIVNSLFLVLLLSSCTFTATACVKPADWVDSDKKVEDVKS